MSLTTKYIFTLPQICTPTNLILALRPAFKKLGNAVLFIFLFFFSQYTFSQNPISGNQGFQILSEGNFTSTNSHHIHGPLAVGGNLVINTPFLGEVNMDNTGSYVFPGDGSIPTGLLVKGSVTWTAGMMRVANGNYIHVGNSTGSITSNNGGTGLTQVLPTGAAYNSTRRVDATVNQPTNVFQTVGFDFTTLFNNYRSTSATLSSRTNNVQLFNSSNVAIAGNTVSTAQSVRVNTLNTGVNYLNLTASSLSNITELVFNDFPSASKVLVINVSLSAGYTWNNVNMTGLGGAIHGAYVLWNFNSTGNFNLTVNQSALVIGTIFAPFMNLIKTGTGDIDGNIIAKTVQLGTGEIHNYQFASDLLNFTNCTSGSITASSNSPVSAGGTINLTSTSTGGSGAQLVTNGNFSNGNSGFLSDYSFGGGYNIAANPQTVWTWAPNCANPSGNMMLGDGNGNTNSRFWYQTINVTAGTTYTLSFRAYDFYGGAVAAKLQWGVNGTRIGAVSNLSSGGCNTWQQVTTTWTATTTGTAVFAIFNNEVSGANNDYAIDDISIVGNASATFSWAGPNGFTSSQQNPTIASATTAMAGIYTVTSTVGGCTATATTNVVVNAVACAGTFTGLFINDMVGSSDVLLTNGSSYNIQNFPSSWNLETTQTGTFGSIVFTITGSTSATNIENAVPYNHPSSTAAAWGLGTYTINIKGYSGGGGTGTLCDEETITITLTNSIFCSGNCTSSNLVVNPQFETDVSGWTASNGQLGRGGGGTFGSFIEINVGDLAGTYAAFQDVAFGANAPYRFTAYAAKHGVNNLPRMYLEFFNGTTFLSKTADILVTKNYDGTFQLISFEGNTPANTTKIRIVGWTQNNALKFDNLSLVGCQACFSIVSPASICVGQSATLTANNCSGTVTWNTGATGSTITVNPTSTTTYTATCGNTTNILGNPSFETGNLTGWDNWGSSSITSVATERQSGTFGARVTATLAGGGFAQNNAAVAGETFTLKAWGRVTSTIPWSGVGLKFMNSSFATLSDIGAEVNATSFQEYTITNTAPAGTTWVQVYAWTDASTIFYVDNFSLVKNITVTTATATVTVNAAPTATATGSTVCVGSTITLGATGGNTYSWSGPASFASTLQNPTRTSATTAMAGIYTVTVTSAAGCTTTATANVVVQTASVGGSLSPASQTICAGVGNLQTANVLTGHSGSVTGWEWSNNGGSTWNAFGGAGLTTNPITCCYTTVGTWNVRAVVQNGVCAAAFAVANIIVVADPTISITGATSICPDDIAILNSTTGNGTGTCTIQWQSSPNGTTWTNISGANAATYITPLLTTTTQYRALYTCTGSNCDQAISNIQIVTVNTAPAAPTATSASRCGAGTVILTGSCPSGTLFWYNEAGLGAALGTGSPWTTPSLSTTTNYTAWCRLATGCWSSVTNVTATINAVPVATATGDTKCVGSTIALTASGGNTYSWTGPNGFTSTLQNPTRNSATTAMAGVYTVTVIAVNGCSATATANVIVSNLTTGSIAGTTNICNGSSTTLTASGGNHYIWNNGSTNAAITVTPTVTTSYSVTVHQNNITNTNLIANVMGFNAANFSLINSTNSFGGPASLFDNVDNLNADTFHALRTTAGANWGIAYNLGGSVLVTNLSIDRRNDCCTDRGEGGVMQVWRNGTMVYQSNVLNNTGDGILAATPAPNVIGTEVRYVFLAGANSLTGEGLLNFTEFIIGGTTLCQGISTATVNVNPMPTAPTSVGASRCGTGTVTMNASGCSGGTISWFASLAGGTALATGTTYTTPSISATTTYFVECSLNGCVSTARNSAVATINNIPTATVSATGACVGGTITLSASGGSSYAWTGPSSFVSATQNPSRTSATTAMTGHYVVTVTSASGCTATANTYVQVSSISASVSNISCNNNATLNTSTDDYFTFLLTPTGSLGGRFTISASQAGSKGAISVTLSNGNPTGNLSYAYPTPLRLSNGTAGGGNVTLVLTDVQNPSCTFSIVVADPGTCNADICTGTTQTVSYSQRIPLSPTELVEVPVNLPKFDNSGGTRILTKVDLKYGMNEVTTVYVENQATTISDVNIAVTGSESMKLGATTLKTFPINFTTSTTIPAAVIVPVQGNYVGDSTYEAFGSTRYSTLYRMDNWLANVADDIYLNPTTDRRWVTNATGNATHDDDIYILPVQTFSFYDSTTYTTPTDLTQFIGTGNIGLTASTINNLNFTGAGGNLLYFQRTRAYAYATVTYSYVCCIAPTAVSASSNSAICSGQNINLTASSTGGSSYSWVGPNGFTSTQQNPTITGATTARSGVYTVTIVGVGTCTATTTTNVVVNAIPTAPTSAGASRCGTGILTMTASGCAGGTISWFGGLTGGVALATGTTYTTPSISSTTTYFLECSINSCISTTRNSAIATINAIPVASATGDTECVGSTISLASSGGNTYSWTGPSGFTSTAQNPTRVSATTAMAGIYTVTAISGAGCTSTATANVIVNVIPSSPTSAGASRCGTGTLTMTASGCAGGTISWFGGLTGGVALATGTTYTTPSISATTTYFLECSINSCISTTRNSAIATINGIPVASATGDTECLGGTISLSAFGGNTYSWAGPSAFTGTSATFSITNAQLSQAGIYSVTVTGIGGCTATATATVIISSVATPTAIGASLCGSGAVAISASGCTGTYNWYSVASGGTSIGSDDSFVTPIISSSTTYYVDCTVDACVSPRVSVTATILTPISATATSNSPYISGGVLNLYGTGSGTYAWSGPNGFNSAQQNPVIPNAGTDRAGTYTLTVTAANGCRAVATVFAATTSGEGIDGNATCNDPIVAGSTKINPSRTGLCLGCSVTGASTVVNGNLADYAEMTIGASIIGGGVAISVQDTIIEYPAGNYAGFTVQPVGNILSTSILGGITVNTYLNGVLQETATSSNGLLKLSIISGYGSLQRVGLLTTKNYDEIQIIANGGLVSFLSGLRVFYAFEEPISCDKSCEQPISSSSFGGSIVSSRSGIIGLLCLGGVSNIANVLDADSTNYASMNLAIGALCQSAISVKANTSFPAGTHAGYVIANAGGLLSLDILGSVRIQTYLNGTIRESINANSSFVSVGLFNPTTNQTAISFKSSLSFDEIRIVVVGTVSLLTQLNVYYPFIRRDADGDGVPDCLDKCPNGSDLADSNGDGVPDACTPEFPTAAIGGDTVCVGQTIFLTSNATQTELLEDNKQCNDAIVGTGVRLNPSLTGICLGCSVSSGAAVIDGDLSNFTQLAIGVSIIGGGTALSVQDTMRRYPAGNYAGFVVQPVGGLLDLSVLSSITIRTFLNGVLQESATIGNSLIGISVLSGNGGLQKVGFITTKTYDEIQIIAGGGLASLLTGLRVYYAFEEPASCWKNCEEAIKVSSFGASIVSARTGVSGLLCLGSVSNSSRLVDNDTTNFATMNLAIGVICQTAVSVRGNTTLPAGTHAGFVVANSGGLLSLSMLGNIRIETYLGGSFRESITLNSNLVTVGLLNSSSPLTRLSFRTGQSFDEVRLVVFGTISLLSQLNVYYSFIRRDTDSDGIPNCLDKCVGNDLADADGDGTPDACDVSNTTLLTYSWAGPGGFTSNLQSPTRPNATTAMGGIYTVTITNSSGFFQTLTTNIIVSPYPTISVTPSSVCAGGNISMNVSGAIIYTWTGPNGFTSNENIIVRTNATTAMGGIYTIVASNYSTCNATSTVAVTVNLLPNAPTVNNVARCDVGAITITASGCSGGTIQWYASQTGTAMLATGTSYSIASLPSSSVYFASCNDINSCVSPSRNYGVASVNSIPEATLTGVGSLCLGYQATNSGKLILTKFKSTDTFSFNIGSSYNSGTASAFVAIPANGEVLTGIADPSTSVTYTVRIKNAENCTIDRVVTQTNQCSACPAGYCEPSTVVKTK